MGPQEHGWWAGFGLWPPTRSLPTPGLYLQLQGRAATGTMPPRRCALIGEEVESYHRSPGRDAATSGQGRFARLLKWALKADDPQCGERECPTDSVGDGHELAHGSTVLPTE